MQTSFGQHAWPEPPHAAHWLFWQTVSGSVQPTSPPQHACPALPHVPPWHPPFVHMPCWFGHVPPDATHVWLF